MIKNSRKRLKIAKNGKKMIKKNNKCNVSHGKNHYKSTKLKTRG